MNLPAANVEPIQTAYLPVGSDQVFALLHPVADPDPAATAVLICQPWGWEEVASYRPRRAWAQRLAAAGHPTLRFDWPATGNSTGSPSDPDLVDRWLQSVSVAAEWLREQGGCERIAALGLGIGGLLAFESIGSGARIDELIAWATPANGRGFVRETRTFSRVLANIQQYRRGADADENESVIPDDWIESSGFVLSAETAASLNQLNGKGEAPAGQPQRALLISRHHAQSGGPLAERLRATGSPTTVLPGGGWGAMVSEPAESKLSLEVAAGVEGWLGNRDVISPAPAAVAEFEGFFEAAQMRFSFAGRPIAEATCGIPPSFGILSRPANGPQGNVCAVFLNSGAVRNIGPNRMWTERARTWAARGVPSFRLDLEGIGEGDGDPDGIPPGAEHFSPKYDAEVIKALDALEAGGLGPNFILVGLCSGAYHAFQTALRDPRVRAVTMINAEVLVWRPEILDERDLRRDLEALDGRRFSRLLHAEVKLSRIWVLTASLIRGAVRAGVAKLRKLARLRRRPGGGWEAQLNQDLDCLELAGTRVLMGFSRGEAAFEELEAVGFPERARSGRWSNLSLIDLPGNDHTLRSTASQAALAQILDRDLEQTLEELRTDRK